MLKASALYLVIIIALVIGVLCASLITVAYFYRLQNQRTFRYAKLDNNLNSGINILLASADTAYSNERTVGLFDTEYDSIAIKKINWGVYSIGIAKAFTKTDTLFRTFSIGHQIDSAKWCALYIADEDRPLGLTGKATIRGNAYLPKAGVKATYIDNRFYEGDKQLVIGKKFDSERELPALNAGKLKQLEGVFTTPHTSNSSVINADSLSNSFTRPTQWVNFGKTVQTLSARQLSGNIILYSDTTLVIDSTAILSNVLVFAKAIKVANGFKGNCQLFATDTITIGKNCEFSYPSAIGLLRLKKSPTGLPPKITIGANTSIAGLVFNYEKTPGLVKPSVTLNTAVKITGELYSQGYVTLSGKDVQVNGSVTTGRFLYTSLYSMYENYLIDGTLDSKALSPYYLSSELMPGITTKKKILQWLEQN